MTETPARYRRRPAEIEAVQWTGHNADALRAFAGSDFDTIDPEDRTDDPDQDAQLLVEDSHWVGMAPGEWVLKFDGYFVTKSDATFRAVWESVPVSSPPADQTALRDRIAATLRTTRRIGYEGKADHGTHRYDARCALCAGDVDALTEALAAAVVPTTNHDTDTSAGAVGRAEYDALVAEADRLRRDGAALHARAEGIDKQLAALQKQVAGPVDRAAVLREAADAVFALEYDVMVGEEGDENMGSMREAWDVGTIHASQLLRRMADQADAVLRRVADETAATETEDGDCDDCGRALCRDCNTHYCIGLCQCGTRAHTCDCACREYQDGLAAGARQDEAQP
ncbi:hypothetical protein ACFVHR_04685 [Streptomyces sp. NPDC127168]|uniref:hypothetical protein n=1 Tax=unclassified Streptomyces TaxID=2593676 RepID=UPI0036303906